MIRHASFIAVRMAGYWRGVLIEGPSGAGKSNLVLRGLRAGFRLVADDRVIIFASQGRLYGRAPDALTGLVESRGIGVTQWSEIRFAEISMLARCVAGPDSVERFPDRTAETLLDVPIPVIDLWPFDVSAEMKLLLALEHLGARSQARYLARFALLGERAGG